MKKPILYYDIFFIALFCIIFLSLLLSNTLMTAYADFSSNHPFLSGFIKFALLATFGESLAQRIAKKNYNPENYGLLPKAILWGILGIFISIAFIMFASGTPLVLNKLGFEISASILAEGFTWQKLLTSFSISFFINTLFAPLLMLTHSLTDAYVAEHKGSIKCFLHFPNFPNYLKNMDWDNFWKFAIVRNITFFWIPMHTITFLLPEAFRLLFAAILGACLGLILTFIKMKAKK